mgnify:CR=1 FL=1
MANHNTQAQPRDAHGHFIKKGDQPQVKNQEKKEMFEIKIEIPDKEAIQRYNRKELLKVLSAKIEDMEKMNNLYKKKVEELESSESKYRAANNSNIGLRSQLSEMVAQGKLKDNTIGEQSNRIDILVKERDKFIGERDDERRKVEDINKKYRERGNVIDSLKKTIEEQTQIIEDKNIALKNKQNEIKKAESFGHFAWVFMSIEAALILVFLAYFIF